MAPEERNVRIHPVALKVSDGLDFPQQQINIKVVGVDMDPYDCI